MKSHKAFTLILRSRRGFTLIELLVAIAIISILAVIGFATFGNSQSSTKDARRKADVNSIARAYETNINSDTGEYQVLDPNQFNGGTKPTPPEGGNYIIVSGPDATTPTKTDFKVCAVLEGGDVTRCTATDAANKCYCKQSSSGLTAGVPPLPACTCPAAATVTCGQTITPSNAPCSSSCPGTGTLCTNGGTCSNGNCSITYTDTFNTGTASTSTQCTNFNNFRTKLSTSVAYSTVQMYSSVNTTGVTCTGTVANQICQAIRNPTGSPTSFSCNDGVVWRTWFVGTSCSGGGSPEVAIDNYCSCSSNWSLRICRLDTYWGGVGSASCPPIPTQTVYLTCY